MTAFSRNLTAFARAFFVAAVLVMLPAPLALAQEDASRPATKADILHLEEAGKRRDTKLDAVTANILRLEEEGKRRDANIAELTKNMAVLAEKMSGLSDKIDAQSQQFHDALTMQVKRMDNMQARMDWLLYSIIGGFFILFLKSHVSQRKSNPAATPAMSAENAKSGEADFRAGWFAALASIASSQDEKSFSKRPRRHNRNHPQ